MEKDGYEQWGSIIGTVIIGANELENLHLMSLRQRFWGSRKWSNIIGFSADGTMFSLGVLPNKKLVKYNVVFFLFQYAVKVN